MSGPRGLAVESMRVEVTLFVSLSSSSSVTNQDGRCVLLVLKLERTIGV